MLDKGLRKKNYSKNKMENGNTEYVDLPCLDYKPTHPTWEDGLWVSVLVSVSFPTDLAC